jgi:hypothetical protein
VVTGRGERSWRSWPALQRDERVECQYGIARLASSESPQKRVIESIQGSALQHPANAAADASSAADPAGSPSDTAHVITPFRHAAVTIPRSES